MADQLRYNAGKPDHCYLATSRTGIQVLKAHAHFNMHVVLEEIYHYLAGHTDSLYEAVTKLNDLSIELPEHFATVCAYGEKKYSRGNYLLGAPVCLYLACALRHLLAWSPESPNDSESGCNHLGHALWNLVMANDQPAHRDNRLRAPVDGPSPDENPGGSPDLEYVSVTTEVERFWRGGSV